MSFVLHCFFFSQSISSFFPSVNCLQISITFLFGFLLNFFFLFPHLLFSVFFFKFEFSNLKINLSQVVLIYKLICQKLISLCILSILLSLFVLCVSFSTNSVKKQNITKGKKNKVGSIISQIGTIFHRYY